MAWLLSICLAVGAAERPLRVGSELHAPPLATGKGEADASGFCVELWREVAREAGLDYQLRVAPFEQLLAEFRAGQLDVLVGLAQSDARRQFADFSVGHVVASGAIFVRADEERIRGEADLADRSIIVVAGDLAQEYAVERGWGAQLVPVATTAEGLRRLAQGREDAMLVNRLVGQQTITDLGLGGLRMVEQPAGYVQKFAIAVRHGETELLARINEGLALTKTSGRYEELYEQWLGLLLPRPSKYDPVRWMLALGILLLLLLAYVGYRRRIEYMIRASEDRLRKVLDSSNDAYIGMDVHGRICEWNREAEAVFGFTRAEVLGLTVAEVIIPPSLREAHERGLRRFVELGEGAILNRRIELYALHRDGHEFPVELSIWPVKTEHGLTFSAFVRDVTQRKKAENDLLELTASLEARVEERTQELAQAKEQAEAASRAKSEFLAIMSHEIRTPMNGVVGMVEVLRQSGLDPDTLDAVTTIRDSALALLQIIDDILDFSKIEAGRLELVFSDCYVSDLVESTCHALVPYAEARDVDLNLMIDPDVPEAVHTDRDRLRRVLTNLIGNAIKFSGNRPNQRGRVEVRVAVAQVAPLKVSFSVIDNGIGMAPETIGRLFQPFSQAEASTTRRFGGTGLGLAICKRLARLFQGEITVSSTLGLGSQFCFTLPLEPAPSLPARPLPDLSGLDCIVVQGPEIDAADLRRLLTAGGARVRLAPTAAAAAQWAARLPAPIVVQVPGRQRIGSEALLQPFAELPRVRHVLIRRGQRRSVRLEADGVVSLDGDALPQRSLLRAVAVAAGRAQEDGAPQNHGPRPGGAPSLAVARARGELVLVAEDDDINQKVILRQLGILGYAAEVADDGAAALALWRRRHHRLLISDLHMPELDGYGLVAAIRAEEAGSGTRTPIIALTANALHGEADRARAAGFDEYLTKPTQLDALAAVVQRYMPSGSTPALPPPPPTPAGPVLNVSVLEGLLGDDDPDIIRGFLLDFRQNLATRAQELIDALAADDRPRVAAIAHKLKSSSRSVGALALGEACAELENAGRSGDRAAIARIMESLTPALQAVEDSLDRLLAPEAST